MRPVPEATRPRGAWRRVGRSPALLTVVVLHVLGWGGLLAVTLPAHPTTGAGAPATVFGVGLGATAYVLGLRHAFDADHIAAIDTTTRRLLAERRSARGVGLWFSLGHSSVVVALCALLVLGIHAVRTSILQEDSAVHVWTGVVGPVVSGVFLVGMATITTAGLVRRMRDGGSGAASHGHAHHRPGGPVSALLARTGAVIDRPSRMYVVGLLFGLGFDTATEVGLLAVAGSASVGAVPWWSVMTLPILFTAGMSLLDAAQGAMSRRAYGWSGGGAGLGARGSGARRYDLGVTLVSIVAAAAIGVVELSGVLTAWLPRDTAWLAPIGHADLDQVGFWLTGVLLVAWGIAAVSARGVPGRSSS